MISAGSREPLIGALPALTEVAAKPSRGRRGGRSDDAGGGRAGVAPVGFEQDDRELVAADPRGHVREPDVVADRLGDVLQGSVARLMAQRVVDLLEAVDVDEQQRGLGVVARGASDLALELLVEPPAAREPGQLVLAGALRGVMDELALLLDRRLQRGVPRRGHDVQLEAHDRPGDEQPGADRLHDVKDDLVRLDGLRVRLERVDEDVDVGRTTADEERHRSTADCEQEAARDARHLDARRDDDSDDEVPQRDRRGEGSHDKRGHGGCIAIALVELEHGTADGSRRPPALRGSGRRRAAPPHRAR